MGTKFEIENYYMGGHCSMRDLNHESNGATWPSFFGDDDGQVCNGSLPRNGVDSHSFYNKDFVKQTMLEHEAIFKNQVYELHRLYRVQREMMDEVRKEQFERQIAYETSSSSSPLPVPLANSLCGLKNVQSSPQSIKGKSIQGSLSPLQNCYGPKNSEVSDSSRPMKHRRMLDLQLPADEYLDTAEVEQFGNANINSSPEKNGNVTLENWKLLLNYTGKSELCRDVLRSDSHASKLKNLADLNEPLHVEETATDFSNRANYSKSSKDVTQSSMHAGLNGISKNYCLENRPSNQDLFCYALESEQQKDSLIYNSQGIHLEKKAARFLHVKALADQAGQSPAFLKGYSWKAKPGVDLEKSDKNYTMSNHNITEQMMTSRLPSQPSFFHPSSSMSQKSMSVQTIPNLAPVTLSRSPQSSSARGNSFFHNKFNLNCSPGANGTFDGESYDKNGFHQESAVTSFKEAPARIPSVGVDSSVKNVFKSTAFRIKDLNLNVALPDDESHDHHESQDPLAVLPWLRGRSSCSNNPETSNRPQILGVPIVEKLTSPEGEKSGIISPSIVEHRSGKEETGTSGRKLVFDMNLPCELSDSEADNMEGVDKEETEIVENKMKNESGVLRNHFDLNSCLTDEEEIPCLSTNRNGDTGIDLEAPIVIQDEEAILPIVEDSPTKDPEKLPPNEATSDEGETELARTAAEAIIAISSLANVVQPEVEVIYVPDEEDCTLHWLADIACDSLPKELDEFECMTLRLKDCTYEEYFPKPSIPEFPNAEEGNKHVLTSRARKGPGRKGRQKRDFQRDILPGLTSLSRNELTEDMQTFGGLMRDTGYSSWQCGPNRKNGVRRARGRPRTAPVAAPVHTEPEPIIIKQHELEMSTCNKKREVGLDDRSLTGWGKTTRRPRRQRLPSATPPLPLSS